MRSMAVYSTLLATSNQNRVVSDAVVNSLSTDFWEFENQLNNSPRHIGSHDNNLRLLDDLQ